MGGLEAYQSVSVRGEKASGFDSSTFVLEELAKRAVRGRFQLLDVGAIYHRYPARDERVPKGLKLRVTAIDLTSSDERVKKEDFFQFDPQARFDGLVLSLVLNFVAQPLERGRMVLKAAAHLKEGGLCFIVLPAHCLTNSRYCKFGLFRRLLSRVGLIMVSDRTTDKLFF